MALERDVTLATLYNIPAVLILRHQSGPSTAEVHIHTLNGPGHAPVKSHVLKLGQSGRFAINVVDDIILVHHQVNILILNLVWFISVLRRKTYRNNKYFMKTPLGLSDYLLARAPQYLC